MFSLNWFPHITNLTNPFVITMYQLLPIFSLNISWVINWVSEFSECIFSSIIHFKLNWGKTNIKRVLLMYFLFDISHWISHGFCWCTPTQTSLSLIPYPISQQYGIGYAPPFHFINLKCAIFCTKEEKKNLFQVNQSGYTNKKFWCVYLR